jgi:hypothetical protein
MAELPDNRLARSRKLARRCWWLIVGGIGSSLVGELVLRAVSFSDAVQWAVLAGIVWVGLTIVIPVLMIVRLHAPFAPPVVVRASQWWSVLLIASWGAIAASSFWGIIWTGPGLRVPVVAVTMASQMLLIAAQIASAILFVLISQTAAEPPPRPRTLSARACWRWLAMVVLVRTLVFVPIVAIWASELLVAMGWIAQAQYLAWLERLPWGTYTAIGTAAYAAELFFIIMLAIRLRAFSQGLIVFRPGLCALCGYDLTGLTEPRCPECGSAAA